MVQFLGLPGFFVGFSLRKMEKLPKLQLTRPPQTALI